MRLNILHGSKYPIPNLYTIIPIWLWSFYSPSILGKTFSFLYPFYILLVRRTICAYFLCLDKFVHSFKYLYMYVYYEYMFTCIHIFIYIIYVYYEYIHVLNIMNIYMYVYYEYIKCFCICTWAYPIHETINFCINSTAFWTKKILLNKCRSIFLPSYK